MLECIVVFLGVLLDQLSKLWVVDAMYQSSMAVWPGVFGFTYVENTGAAFGVLGKSTLVLTVVSALAMVVLCFVLVKFRKELSKFGRVGLALIIAGGLGNLIDRVFLGYVVDFINLEFMHFAVFNVADICATVGTICLLIAIIFGERKKGKGELSADGERDGQISGAADQGGEAADAAGKAEDTHGEAPEPPAAQAGAAGSQEGEDGAADRGHGA